MTAARPVSSVRSVSAASAPATLPTLELTPLSPGICCPTFHQNTCKLSFLWQIIIQLIFHRAMQAITENWVALEDEEDEEEGEGEEVMRALFVEEEDDKTDAESDGDAVEEVFELF